PSTVAMIEDDESELRLVAASSDGAGLGQGGGDSSNDRSVDLSLANEQIEVVSQENAELKDRMREAETIIDDLKRLISLKDDELAALQQQMAGGGVVEPVEEMEAAIDTEGDPVFVEEPTDLIEDAEEYAVEDPVDEPEEDLLVEDQEEEPAVEDPQSSVSVVTETPAPASMLDKALGFIMGNLTMIAGALGGLILAIIALLFISRRKQNSESESVALASTEFPDFDDSEASVAKADEESAEMEATAAGSEDETVLPVEGSNEQEGVESAASPEPQEVVAAPEPDEPEEDLLGEVNVFLAYEHFDQAEEFVREAIAGSPDNLDFHAKLLEVFYAASDKKSYEEAAQVMHDKVNGQGPHWEMTQAMWQEMSPNRALFEEGADEPETAPEAESTGGIMDITAEESDAAGAGADLDFDLGMGGEIAAETSAEAESEDMLDLTAESDDVSVLDLTAAANVEDFSSDEDLLDVTAAVGLETEESIGEADSETADDEPILDITSAGEQTAAGDEDVLDFSHGGGEDLLDVTANANLEPEGLNEDLLDVTSAVGAEADGEELLEISTDEPAEDDNSVDFDIGGIDETADEAETEAVSEETSDDNALDFDIGGMDIEPPESESDDNTGSGDDNVLDFDMGSSDEEVAIELDADDAEDDGGIELDLSLGDEDVSLDIEEESIEETAEISIDDLEDSLDSGLEIDLSIDDDIDFGESLDVADLKMDDGEDDLDLEIDLTLDDEDEEGQAESLDAGLDMDFDLEIQEDNDGVPEIDMDGTVEMPSLDVEDMGIEIDDDDDDDDDDEHTVFVPRASAANEQSTEDEIATKLDLAKAYVELGDKDSAKGILDEVLADGNDEQKQTAQDLIKQLD
ncbi:MAG: pilus assembly protein FimV, partial [Gammaproteobacteria bacterium]